MQLRQFHSHLFYMQMTRIFLNDFDTEQNIFFLGGGGRPMLFTLLRFNTWPNSYLIRTPPPKIARITIVF